MPDSNGNRLDRIEAVLEKLAERQVATDANLGKLTERLDKLAERHTALTQSVELLAGMHRENEQLFARLVRIIENHERRLEDLEGA